MTSEALLFLSVALGPAADDAGTRPAGSAADVVLYDRLHQTFLALGDVVIPAYLDHFRDEPEQLAVVRYYADRLAEAHRGVATSLPAPATDAAADTPPVTRMRAALAEARRDNVEILQHHLSVLGAQTHAVVQRADATGEASTARCPLFDPELLWAHRRLWELRTGRRAPADPENLRDALATRHAAILAARKNPDNSDLSLRKFLDLERQTVWELAWLYRCLGVEQERGGDAAGARQSYMRAWAIGDALFPAAERGRLERFDPVFLAELGDIYVRLSRFDLMLRYMYSENGLPARFEMARPIAELVRVAESVRLARPGEKPSEDIEETFPETVSQILFEQAVPFAAGSRSVATTDATGQSSRKLAYVFIGVGCLLLGVGVAALVRRVTVAQRAERPLTPATLPRGGGEGLE